MKKLLPSIALIFLGALAAVAFTASAHPPCSALPPTYDPPNVWKDCKYVQVINPYTGILETQYVCN